MALYSINHVGSINEILHCVFAGKWGTLGNSEAFAELSKLGKNKAKGSADSAKRKRQHAATAAAAAARRKARTPNFECGYCAKRNFISQAEFEDHIMET
mgnify:CR=1 FL=1